MKKIMEVKLRDGALLEIVRIISPEECRGTSLPDWVLPFFQYNLPECWQLYYNDIFAGKTENVRDHMYAGIVNGVPCSRMWFGYSEKTGVGNFGNVETLPEYRRRGIMREILKPCIADIAASDALFCSCDAAVTAAPAYEAAGFQRIFSPELHPMAFTRPGAEPFSAVVEKAYGDIIGAWIRPGTLCDRFDCDKLLMYAPEVYGTVIPSAEIQTYLSLWQEYVCTGKTTVKVLETKTGFCVGYAAWVDETPYCVLHPKFTPYRDTLLDKAKEQ